MKNSILKSVLALGIVTAIGFSAEQHTAEAHGPVTNNYYTTNIYNIGSFNGWNNVNTNNAFQFGGYQAQPQTYGYHHYTPNYYNHNSYNQWQNGNTHNYFGGHYQTPYVPQRGYMPMYNPHQTFQYLNIGSTQTTQRQYEYSKQTTTQGQSKHHTTKTTTFQSSRYFSKTQTWQSQYHKTHPFYIAMPVFR